VKVRVDRERCHGHNRCYDIAPDLFVIDDFGFAAAARNDDIPSEREAQARLAALSCPEQAIVMEDGTT
jgi:ferredoxin